MINLPEDYRGDMSMLVVQFPNALKEGEILYICSNETSVEEVGLTKGFVVRRYRSVNELFAGKLQSVLVEVNRGRLAMDDLKMYLEADMGSVQ